MKKLSIIIFLALAVLKIQAQDYLISFAGTGGGTTVDSVQVNNLAQNTSLTLNGTDILHLMGVVGIDHANDPGNADLKIYPNPSIEHIFIEFEAACSGIAAIEVFDLIGKHVVQAQYLLPYGRHKFVLSGLRSGIYPLRVKSAGYVYSGKIVCKNTGLSNPKISYLSCGIKSTAKFSLRSIQSLVPMQYNEGDQLLFKCFSGIYSTVIPLIPTQSQTVTVNFVECTDADNNNYATVTIGPQIWMAENLNVGVRIVGIQVQTNNSTIEKYCYNDSLNNCTMYGGLYQWNEMMQYVTTEGVQGICPTGWHIPTDAQWTRLTDFLGGEDLAGVKMKSTGTIEAGTGLWHSPNTGATNESGFSAVPAGLRLYSNGAFGNVGIQGYWWSSSVSTPSYADSRYLHYFYPEITRPDHHKNGGLSVRCLRNL
jgi:uncharacterized protein (TIGR02145 family)